MYDMSDYVEWMSDYYHSREMGFDTLDEYYNFLSEVRNGNSQQNDE